MRKKKFIPPAAEIINEVTAPSAPDRAAVSEQAQAIMRVRADSLLESRLDLRGTPTLAFAVSPDEPVCCAMSYVKSSRGYTFYVHVADVTEFVEPGTPLDDAALLLCEGLPGKKYLFPPELINETFSFVTGEDRPALSVILDFDEDGAPRYISCDETVVRVDRRCLFSEIDELEMNGDASAVMALRAKYSPFGGTIDDLYALAAKLRAERRERGGMIIPRYEPHFSFNSRGVPVSFSRTAEPDSRAMLRELLIYAASSLGELCRKEHFPMLFTGRRYFKRPALHRLADAFGLELIERRSRISAETALCEAASGLECEPTLADELRLYMPPRVYSPTPAMNAISGVSYNVGFTKPTLRYADLVNHRVLKTLAAAKRSRRLVPGKELGPECYVHDIRAALSQTVAGYAGITTRAAEEAALAAADAELEERRGALTTGTFVRGYCYDDRVGHVRILLDNNLRLPYLGDSAAMPHRGAADMRIVRTSNKLLVEAF